MARGTAVDLLRVGTGRSWDGRSDSPTGWPKNPRALAGRLRRAQTFLRALGIDIAFSREGHAGNRVIRMRATRENTVGTVSSVARVVAIRRRTTCAAALLVSDPNHGPGLVEPCRPVTTASRRQTRPTVWTIPAD